ncbi:MAG: hypothetical protein PHU81_07535 [Acidobacteriota bacterium]|nr:hypothetical protein [Acidobacteriota bacterium]
MKRIKIFVLIMSLSLLLASGQELVFEQKLPPGWKFKQYYPRALYLIQDISEEQLVKGNTARRLMIFDNRHNIIADFIIPDNYWFNGFIGENILLADQDESGVSVVRLVDLNQKEIYRVETQGRWPQPALLGHDFALVPDRDHLQTGSISIMDGETGQEKFRFGPFSSPKGPIIPDSFELIGEGFYLVGMGASLFLKSYSEPRKTIWQIQNIGGNIRDARALNKELIVVGYGFEDVEKGKFMVGAAIIDWKTGEILFDRKAFRRGHNQDPWYDSLEYLYLTLDEEGGLILMEDEDGGTRFELKSNSKKGWDEKRTKKIKLWPPRKEIKSSVTGKGRVEIHGKTVIKDFGSYIRVEKRKYIKD